MQRSAELRLTTERLVLSLPAPDAAVRVASYLERNRAFHKPWDPPRPRGYLSEPFWRQRLAASRQEYLDDVSLRLFLSLRDDPEGEIVGTANFSAFSRGAFQACRLGYGLGEAFEGQGFMFEALSAAIAHVFGPLRLHRIEANYVPTNERSGRLLRRLGFTVDGYSRDYLYIDGTWRDHVLTSLTNPAPMDPP